MFRILSPLYLFILSALYFFTALDGSKLLTERDLSVFFLPPRLLWTELVASGQFPLWNPLMYCGQPLLATLQPGIFYPANLLLLILPFDLGFNSVIILHYFLSGLFVLLLLGELGVSRSARLIGALTFMLCGYLFSVHNVLSTLLSVTWVPLALFFFLRALRRNSIKQAALTTITMAVMFTGGGIEVLLATFGLLFLLVLWPGMFDFELDGIKEPHKISARLKLFIFTCVIFLTLSAVQLLPFAELASLSTRSEGLSYFEATTWSFDIKDFMQFLIPDLYGYASSSEKYWANQSWLKTVYTGTLPLLLTIFFFARYRRKALLLLFVALLFFMLAMGKNSLIYPYLYNYMPFFAKIRYPVKFLFVPFLFLAITAGFGADAIKKFLTEKSRHTYTKAVLIITATAAALLFGLLSFYHLPITEWLIAAGYDYPEYNYAGINLFNTKRLLVFIIISLLGVYAAFSSKKLRLYLPFFIIVVLSADLFFAHNSYYRTSPAKEYHAPGEVMRFVKKDRTLFRVFVTPKTLKEGAVVPLLSEKGTDAETTAMSTERLVKEKLEGYNLEHGVYDISGVNVMKRRDYAELYETMASGAGIDSTNLLSMMNVKYVISTPPIDSAGFKLIHIVGLDSTDEEELKRYEEAETIKIYENLNVLPRYYIAEDFFIMKKKQARLEQLASKDFTPSSAVILEDNPWMNLTLPEESSDIVPEEASVLVLNRSASSTELKVSTPAPAVLVTSESWYPGWKVFVDGVESQVLKANHAFKAVALNDGIHNVRFVYSPTSFKVGALVSGITLTVLFFLLIRQTKRRRLR